MRYIVTAFVFLLVGGVEALVMRVQLAEAGPAPADAGAYDQLFSMHGDHDDLPVRAAVLSGFSNYLWPLLLGSRDMAFPRLNALSYWVYLCAGVFLYAGFPLGAGAQRRLVQLRAPRLARLQSRASTSTSMRSG